MTTKLFPPPTTPGPNTTTDRVLLRAQALATTSYVASDDVKTLGVDYIVFGFLYTKGDETSHQVRVEGFNGTDWVPLGYKDSPTSGLSELTPDVLQLTASSYASGANGGDVGSAPYYCAGYQRVRCQVKRTGGTDGAAGTIGVTATGVVARGI